jgi:hypothetical protein
MTIPIKNGTDIDLFPFVIKCKIIELIKTNKIVCEIPLPEPNFKKSRNLSIISGSNEPIINENLLNSNLLLIRGNSKIISGTAT